MFYQGLGDFTRGDPRVESRRCTRRTNGASASRVTLNYGLRYERINPFTEIEDRLNGFVPGVQSQRPAGCAARSRLPGRCRASAAGIARQRPRVHAARRRRLGSDRRRHLVGARGYGLFYDQFQNGAGTASQVAISATPWAQFDQFSGAGLNFQNPYQGRPVPEPDTFVRPSTVFALDADAKPPYVQQLERRRAAVAVRSLRRGGPLRRRRGHGPAAQRRGESCGLWAAARPRRTPTAGASTPNCPADGERVRLLDHRDAARASPSRSYHAGQASLSRRYGDAASASTCRTGTRGRTITCRR